MKVLIVEDGHEYIETMSRYLGEGIHLERAGDGIQALEMLGNEHWDVVFMDMRFDRAQRLLGEDPDLLDRFAGDSERLRRFLERHQGTYIAHAIRNSGHSIPILFSYDFGRESARWAHLRERLTSVAYVHDTAGPADVRTALKELYSE